MQTITRNCGETFTFEMTKDDLTPIELDGITRVRFLIKKKDSGTVAIDKEILAPESNIVLFQLDSTETRSIDIGRYIGALKIYRENNMDTEIWNDEFNVINGVI